MRRGVHGVTGVGGLVGVGVERAPCQRGRADRQLAPRRARTQRREQLAGDPPGSVVLEWPAARSQHGDPARLGAARDRRQQTRLTDPRRALDDDHAPASPSQHGELARERGQLGVPIEQRVGH